MSMGRRAFLAAGSASALAGVARGALPAPIERLKSRLKGGLVLRSDPAFETLRRVASFNPRTDQRPLAIARCADAADVARSIEAARVSGLDLAVRAGGHDVLGAGDCAGGLVIDLRPMTQIQIDAPRRRARVGAGVISANFNQAAGEAGLAPVLGCNPAVGVSGLTLGGGLGWLLGANGAACDHLRAAEVITADGRRLRIDAHSHPDLFWALRGGGGNFGVVTDFDFELVSVREVLGGPIAFRLGPPGAFSDLLRRYRDLMSDAPDQLAVELSTFYLDEPVIAALVCWCGPLGDGERVLTRLRSFGAPVFDMVRPAAFGRFAAQGGGGAPPYLYWRGASLDTLTDAAAEAIEAQVRAGPTGWSFGLGHVMHGQVVQIAQDATPFVRRPGRMAYFLGAGWTDPAQAEARMAWVDAAMTALAAQSSRVTYVNYLSDDRPEAIEAAYGPNYARLRTIKRRYDPDNVFRHNRNIRP